MLYFGWSGNTRTSLMRPEPRKCKRCGRKQLKVAKTVCSGRILLWECLFCGDRMASGDAEVSGWPTAQIWIGLAEKKRLPRRTRK